MSTTTARTGAALTVAGLDATIDRTAILRSVAAELPSGAVSAVVGPNGSGKSTLLRVLVGALAADRGAVLLDGRELAALSRRTRARELALVEQDSAAAVAMDVLDVVLLGRTPHRAAWGADSEHDLAVAHDTLRRTGADGLVGRDVATLSGGERQRVHLARALAQAPRLLMLDEPTNHLDVAAQLDVLHLAGELAAGGVTVLTALHDLNHALRYCDHVVVLDGGRVVAAGAPTEVLTEELVSRVYGVRAERVQVRGREMLVFERG
ncbi:ABC transporter ATP-binding protein [Georgenia sunbinii]|uniref:ABC transporter ATP-binding protein n=1 Tax=Georgenia sunbinii TaxID=3117728 RepID=UPI002F262CDE